MGDADASAKLTRSVCSCCDPAQATRFVRCCSSELLLGKRQALLNNSLEMHVLSHTPDPDAALWDVALCFRDPPDNLNHGFKETHMRARAHARLSQTITHVSMDA